MQSLKKKSKKKKLAITSYFMSVDKYGWGVHRICIDQSRFYNFSQPRELKNV